ncbi:MAG: serine/threonine-protein kinase [Gemmatimonadetes bacterium]|nr:serine/threonine-protein kinase [Gemmatimonadota bacterium]
MRHLLTSVQEALKDRYLVKSEVGRGSVAGVFFAWDHDRACDVAIKVLRPDYRATIIAERFHREIQFLSVLDHPNILPILDSGEQGALLYFTMPFAHGDTLGARITGGGQLPIEETLAITRDIAGAIDHAHSKNIIHRDIKPENVVFEESQALICDFGIARAVVTAGGERLSSSGLIVGTPEYMSPEQAAGQMDVGEATDIYALACLVYTMLAGEPPFTGPTTQAVMARHIAGKPPKLVHVRPEVSENMRKAIEWGMAREPEDRPPSAMEFVGELRPN